jgi:serine/threonine protein kinase
MEYSNDGDLLKYVKMNGKIPEDKARYFFKNIAIGLGHIHCRSVLH